MAVLAEVAEQAAFDLIELAGEAHQTGAKIPRDIRHAAEHEGAAKPPVGLEPRVFKEPVVQFIPVANSDRLHNQCHLWIGTLRGHCARRRSSRQPWRLLPA